MIFHTHCPPNGSPSMSEIDPGTLSKVGRWTSETWTDHAQFVCPGVCLCGGLHSLTGGGDGKLLKGCGRGIFLQNLLPGNGKYKKKTK